MRMHMMRKLIKFEIDRINIFIKDVDLVITIPKIVHKKGYGIQFPTTILFLKESYFQKFSFYIGFFGFGIGFSYKPSDDHKLFR